VGQLLREIELVRVVVVSPSDVAGERDIVTSVADELNRRVAPAHGCRLSVWRWETDARPGLHLEGPQGLIDERMEIDDADVVIGIFWKRFGTPTGDAASGTEHELRRAWKAWRQRSRPDVMVYFCHREEFPASMAEAEQLHQVLRFREELPQEQLWWPYRDTVEFERLVRGHLEEIVLRRAAERESPKTSASAGGMVQGPREVLEHPGARLRAWRAPSRNLNFTGRSELLARVRELLTEEAVALYGMGGVGKTQLALEYAHKFADEYDIAWWVKADQTTLIAEQLVDLAEPLGLPAAGPVAETAAAVRDALAARDRWLLVFDNAESPAALSPWLPRGRGYVLITSQKRTWQAIARPVEVREMPRTESVALLRRLAEAIDETNADRLAHELGDLPPGSGPGRRLPVRDPSLGGGIPGEVPQRAAKGPAGQGRRRRSTL
jgi:NB-ARC domain